MKSAQVDVAARMREEGTHYKDIAAELGVATTTIYSWLHPEYAERQRALSRDAKRRRQQASCKDCGKKLAYDRQDNERCWRCQDENDYGERRKRVTEAWEAGTPTQEIANAEGMTYRGVLAFVDSQRRLQGKPVSRRRTTNRDRWDEIEPLFREGLTYSQIGATLGMEPRDVGSRVQAMRKAGIDLPRRRKVPTAP